MSRPGGPLTLEVTAYANGGAGIARSDGRVVFVDGALPGERVRARITDDSRSSYAKAAVEEVLTPSAHRVAPRCPAAAAGAGCCDLAFVEPAYARRLGADALADVLRRIGRFDLDELPPPDVEPLSGASTGWRIRTRLAVGRDGRAGLRGRRSAEIVTEPCVAPVAGLLEQVDGLGARPGTEIVLMAGTDGVRHAGELAAPREGDVRGRRRGDAARRRAQRSRGARSAPRELRMLVGDGSVTHRVGDRSWRIPVTGFWQAHRNAPEVYSAAVVDLLAEAGVAGTVHAWDLYGGAGVFSAALIDAGSSRGLDVASVDLVDTDPSALAAAAAVCGADPVTTHRGGVAETLGGLRSPQVVVSDPPRAGAGLSVVDGVAAAGPEAVVHVGCDAASFARDLGRYAVHGYRVRGWRAFDAFPLTHHIEAVAVLTR